MFGTLSNFRIKNFREITDINFKEIREIKDKNLIKRSYIFYITVSFDKKANALYIRISSEKVLNSDEIAEGIIIDYDKKDNIVGVRTPYFFKRGNIKLL